MGRKFDDDDDFFDDGNRSSGAPAKVDQDRTGTNKAWLEGRRVRAQSLTWRRGLDLAPYPSTVPSIHTKAKLARQTVLLLYLLRTGNKGEWACCIIDDNFGDDDSYLPK